MFIGVKHIGDFHLTEQFLKKAKELKIETILDQYGKLGVEALAEATPKRTGRTAASWSYEVEKTGAGYSIHWINSNTNRGENIAMLIQTGHGTGWHVYVQGKDYINHALEPIYEGILIRVWNEVINA